jgi:hypothetical protein
VALCCAVLCCACTTNVDKQTAEKQQLSRACLPPGQPAVEQVVVLRVHVPRQRLALAEAPERRAVCLLEVELLEQLRGSLVIPLLHQSLHRVPLQAPHQPRQLRVVVRGSLQVLPAQFLTHVVEKQAGNTSTQPQHRCSHNMRSIVACCASDVEELVQPSCEHCRRRRR